MSGIVFDLPLDVIEQIAQRAAAIISDRPRSSEPWLDVAGAAAHLACPKSRIYALSSANRIPHAKDGSRLLFRASELDEWLQQGGGKRP